MQRWLSSSRGALKARYDVVVVGSGYGGSVAALRCAQAGGSVCLLERGREILPGDYPETVLGAARETQLHFPGFTINPGGMFDYHYYGELNVLLGCGLGGGSLINAGVCVFPDGQVFEEKEWPRQITDDYHDGSLGAWYDRAARMLRPEQLPSPVSLKKLDLLFETLDPDRASEAGRPVRQRAFAGVHYDGNPDPGYAEVPMKPCVQCGNCVSGCNHWAKKTLIMNYLPEARRLGAEIFTGLQVRYVTRHGEDSWRVYYRGLEDGRECFADAPDSFIVARNVVLSAGTIGTTEILFRSQQEGLPLSNRLGRGFSGNGDVFALAYNGKSEVNGVGWHRPDHPPDPVGATIAGVVDLRKGDLKTDLLVEEGAIPSALAPILPFALWAASWWGTQEATNTFDRMMQTKRSWVSLMSLCNGAYVGADRNTLVYLVMSHDDVGEDDGRIEFHNDRVRVRWPQYAKEGIFQHIAKTLQEGTQRVQGVYVPDPLTGITGTDLMSVHPLGGCPMGNDTDAGVVDDCGRVFNGNGGHHEGLFVMDGSFIPRSLGVNPLLTITALAERACEKLGGLTTTAAWSPAAAGDVTAPWKVEFNQNTGWAFVNDGDRKGDRP